RAVRLGAVLLRGDRGRARHPGRHGAVAAGPRPGAGEEGRGSGRRGAARPGRGGRVMDVDVDAHVRAAAPPVGGPSAEVTARHRAELADAIARAGGRGHDAGPPELPLTSEGAPRRRRGLAAAAVLAMAATATGAVTVAVA